jgi:hypothetical protein
MEARKSHFGASGVNSALDHRDYLGKSCTGSPSVMNSSLFLPPSFHQERQIGQETTINFGDDIDQERKCYPGVLISREKRF